MTREEAIEIVKGLNREQLEQLWAFLDELEKEYPPEPQEEGEQ